MAIQFAINPAYRLVAYEQLAPAVKAALADLCNDADFWGLLVPAVPAALPMKSVCRNSAALINELVSGSSATLNQDSTGAVRALVATLLEDHVLQAITADGAISGTAAARQFAVSTEHAADVPSFIAADPSHQAIQYAFGLRRLASAQLAGRLYFYGRVPLSCKWLMRFPASGFQDSLGLTNPHVRSLLAKWNPVGGTEVTGWYVWQKMRRKSDLSEQSGTHKVYFCPHPEHAGEATSVFIRAVIQSDARALKIPANLQTLLRPDKYVAYCASENEAKALALSLYGESKQLRAQPLPFAAICDETGLTAIGFDPKTPEGHIKWMEKESSRIWIVNRVASSINIARHEMREFEVAWPSVMRRLDSLGVDTKAWRPKLQ